MTRYRVFGRVMTNFGHECNCEHCDQNSDKVIKDLWCDVEAIDEDEAIKKAEKNIPDFLAWEHESEIEAFPIIPRERPPLAPDVEREWLRRWVEGAGLPGERVT